MKLSKNYEIFFRYEAILCDEILFLPASFMRHEEAKQKRASGHTTVYSYKRGKFRLKRHEEK